MAWRRGIAGIGAASCSFAGAAYFYRPDPSGEVLESHSDLSRRIKSSKVRIGAKEGIGPCAVAAVDLSVASGRFKERSVLGEWSS